MHRLAIAAAPRDARRRATSRTRRFVALASLYGGAGGCRDAATPTSPAQPPTATFSLTGIPPEPVLAQRGIALTFAAVGPAGQRAQTLDVFVDRGTAAERHLTLNTFYFSETPTTVAVIVPPVDGPHTITVVGTDSAGHVRDTAFTRQFRLPVLRYTVTALAGLGGTETAALGLNERGDVVGRATTATGQSRAVVWRAGRAGAPTVLPADTTDAVADRINDQGDVLGTANGGPQIWRADGQVVRVAPITFTGVSFYGDWSLASTCCRTPVDLNNQGVALVAGQGAAFVDVAAGTTRSASNVLSLTGVAFSGLNDAGQAVEQVQSGMYEWKQVLIGGAVVVADPVFPYCEYSCTHQPTAIPVGIDSAGNTLVTGYPGFVAYGTGLALSIPRASEYVHLDAALGPTTSSVLSRRGGLVVAYAPADAVLGLWRLADRTTSRLQLSDPAWQVDAVTAVNARGTIAAHATNTTTGQGGAVVLTPAGP